MNRTSGFIKKCRKPDNMNNNLYQLALHELKMFSPVFDKNYMAIYEMVQNTPGGRILQDFSNTLEPS